MVFLQTPDSKPLKIGKLPTRLPSPVCDHKTKAQHRYKVYIVNKLGAEQKIEHKKNKKEIIPYFIAYYFIASKFYC